MLAGALIEVARAVLAQPVAATVPAHSHADQVAVGWLDDNLRSLVARGPLSDPAVEGRVGGVERQLALLGARIEALAARVDDTGRRLSSVATNDLIRANDVAVVRRGIDGLGDARLDVVQLRASLGELQAGVSTAVAVGQQLTIDGQPANLSTLNDRLKAVEALRARLTSPAGRSSTPAQLDQRLQNLQTDLVTRDDLTHALADHSATLSDTQLAELQAGAADSAVAAVTPTVSAATDAIRAETTPSWPASTPRSRRRSATARRPPWPQRWPRSDPSCRPPSPRPAPTWPRDRPERPGRHRRAAGRVRPRIDAVTSGLGPRSRTSSAGSSAPGSTSVTATLNSLSTRLDATEGRIKDRDTTFAQLTGPGRAEHPRRRRRPGLARGGAQSDLDRRDQVAATHPEHPAGPARRSDSAAPDVRDRRLRDGHLGSDPPDRRRRCDQPGADRRLRAADRDQSDRHDGQHRTGGGPAGRPVPGQGSGRGRGPGMIADLEQRLVEVIGAALPAPFTGTTAVAPGPAPGPGPALVLGDDGCQPAGPRLRQRLPGPSRRRRWPTRCGWSGASCTLAVELRAGAGQGRPQQLAGLDALLYLLDGPEFRSGTALGDGTDHGFLLDSLRVLGARTLPDPAAPSEPPVVLNLVTQGWFWPPGTPGTAGAPIVEIRLRGVDLPLSTNVPRLVAGAPAHHPRPVAAGDRAPAAALPPTAPTWPGCRSVRWPCG